MKKVCIVGSGPAAFYTAQYLLKHSKTVLVHLLEKLPVAHGLVRYGVAPDHQDVKNVENKFLQTITSERLKFFGCVEVGHTISVTKLRQMYDAVVLSYGTSQPRKLGVPGEFANGVISAHDFVSWYNGHPHHCNWQPDLKRTETAVLIGQGNVSLDVARILLTDPDKLAGTDISRVALNCLRESSIKTVFCVGRRFLPNVAFTIKEFREITKIPTVQTSIEKTGDALDLSEFARPKKRLIEFCQQFQSDDFNGIPVGGKKLVLLFGKKPLEMILNEDSMDVRGIRFLDSSISEKTGCEKVIKTGIVIKSIGYEHPVVIDPMLERFLDKKNSCFLHQNGKMDDGLFCSGWAKTGPVGVIASTLNDSHQTAKTILDELERLPKTKTDKNDIQDYLEKFSLPYVDKNQWMKLFEKEIVLGKSANQPRVKFESILSQLDAMR